MFKKFLKTFARAPPSASAEVKSRKSSLSPKKHSLSYSKLPTLIRTIQLRRPTTRASQVAVSYSQEASLANSGKEGVGSDVSPLSRDDAPKSVSEQPSLECAYSLLQSPTTAMRSALSEEHLTQDNRLQLEVTPAQKVYSNSLYQLRDQLRPVAPISQTDTNTLPILIVAKRTRAKFFLAEDSDEDADYSKETFETQVNEVSIDVPGEQETGEEDEEEDDVPIKAFGRHRNSMEFVRVAREEEEYEDDEHEGEEEDPEDQDQEGEELHGNPDSFTSFLERLEADNARLWIEGEARVQAEQQSYERPSSATDHHQEGSQGDQNQPIKEKEDGETEPSDQEWTQLAGTHIVQPSLQDMSTRYNQQIIMGRSRTAPTPAKCIWDPKETYPNQSQLSQDICYHVEEQSDQDEDDYQYSTEIVYHGNILDLPLSQQSSATSALSLDIRTPSEMSSSKVFIANPDLSSPVESACPSVDWGLGSQSTVGMISTSSSAAEDSLRRVMLRSMGGKEPTVRSGLGARAWWMLYSARRA